MPQHLQDMREIEAPDGRTLCCFRWYPAGPVRGRVLFLHGIESHPRWFEGTCQWLARLGFHVAALQRRGSGTDASRRGDSDGYRTWLRDVELLAGQLSGEGPSCPSHLLGISWGGKLASACAAAAPTWMTSLILISPGLAPRVDVPFLTKVRIGLCSLFSPEQRFDLPIGETRMFTANQRWREFIANDSLRLKNVTARFLVENVKLDRYLRSRLSKIQVPVLTLLAQTDEIIDKKKTKAMISRFGSSNKKILEYSGTTHTLEFEDNPDLWRKDLLAWLDAF